MKKDIYVYLPTGKQGASSRYRVLQYKEELDKNFNLIINEFLDDVLYSDWKKNKLIKLFLKLPFKIIHTIKFSIKIPNKSVVLIHRDILPFGNMWLEKMLKRKKCKIIVDIDDAIFISDTSEISSKKNKFFYNLKYGKRYDKLFKISDKVICGNKYLENHVKNFCENTKIIPTVIDVSHIMPKKSFNVNSFSIVWIGNPGNTGYIIDILPIINKVSEEMNMRININLIGSKIFDVRKYKNLEIKFNKWSSENEYELIKESDIGIMPLKNSEWAKGKCSLKLLQYMAAGIPVIGSDVGENKNVIINGENGFLATDNKDWESHIKYYIKNRNKIEEMGKRAREFVEERYSLEEWKKILVNYVN